MIKSLYVIVLMLFMSLTSDLKSSQVINIREEDQTLINRFRLHYSSVWGKKLLTMIPFVDKDKKDICSLEVSLHHLAGNAQFILNTYNNSSDYENLRDILSSRDMHIPNYKEFLDKKMILLPSRNPLDDVNKIIDVIRNYNLSQDKLTLFDSIKNVESELGQYRELRKLTYIKPDYKIEPDEPDYEIPDIHDYD